MLARFDEINTKFAEQTKLQEQLDKHNAFFFSSVNWFIIRTMTTSIPLSLSEKLLSFCHRQPA